MQECPNCKEKTISNWTKASLGTGQSVTCNNCGAKLTLPKVSVIHVAVVVILINFILTMNYSYRYPVVGLIIAAVIAWQIYKVDFVEK